MEVPTCTHSKVCTGLCLYTHHMHTTGTTTLHRLLLQQCMCTTQLGFNLATQTGVEIDCGLTDDGPLSNTHIRFYYCIAGTCMLRKQ